ncbi:MAG: solute carrier family 23 protein, partial [Collinsella bouchesdurhonensis]|nr:solute carrier family 23 protein [Collinsella bouchesdurhonensis]
MADVSTPEEDALFTPRGHVSLVTAIPLALQHVLAAFAAIVTPAIIVASVCGFSAAEEARIIQAALVLSAVDTLLQQFPLFGRIGSGLPIVMGASFTFVPAFQAIGVEMGFEAVLGAQLVGGLLVVVFGLAFRRLRFLFPPVVMGTVIFVIGLSLCPVAVKSMAGGQGSAGFGDLSNWIVAIATFVVTFA